MLVGGETCSNAAHKFFPCQYQMVVCSHNRRICSGQHTWWVIWRGAHTESGPLELQVVVQPYLKMVLRALSAGTSKYVQSAAPLPIEWRYMIKLSVHNSALLDVQVRLGPPA